MNPSGVACSIPRPGIWATLASALGYSFCSVCAKKISEEYSPFQALYVRGLITTILAIGILMYDTSLPIPHKAVRVFAGWAFGRGILGAIVLGTYYYALTILPLSEAAVIFSLGPITSTVASRIVLGEPITGFRIFSLVWLVIGAVFACDPVALFTAFKSDSDVWLARGLIVISSVCDGVCCVCSRKLSMENSHWMTQGFWYGAASMMFAPLAGFAQDFVVIEKSNAWLIGFFIGIGLSGIFAEVTFGYATTREEGAILGVLSNASLIFSLIWQQTIFRTNITWYQGVAVACIIIASVVCVGEKKYYEWRNGAAAAPSSPTESRPLKGHQGPQGANGEFSSLCSNTALTVDPLPTERQLEVAPRDATEEKPKCVKRMADSPRPTNPPGYLAGSVPTTQNLSVTNDSILGDGAKKEGLARSTTVMARSLDVEMQPKGAAPPRPNGVAMGASVPMEIVT